MDDSTTLSVCIPTYNRSSILYNNLKNNLKLELEDIEFIVMDNGSNDNTEFMVKKIHDKRLKYFKNDRNLGFDVNLLRAVEKSSGDYIFLLSDEDLLNIKEIKRLVNMLRENKKYALILGSIGNNFPEKTSYLKYYDDEKIINKNDRIVKILYNFSLCHYGYMSGIVLKKESLKPKTLYIYNRSDYTHYALIAQAIKYGPVLTTCQIFCYIGKQYKNNVNFNINPYELFSHQVKMRIKIINDMFDKEECLKKRILNNERNMLAYRLAWCFHSPFDIKNFFYQLPYIIHINELEIKKFDFWLKFIIIIPIRLFKRILKINII